MKSNVARSLKKSVLGLLALSLVLSFQNCAKARFTEVAADPLNPMADASGEVPADGAGGSASPTPTDSSTSPAPTSDGSAPSASPAPADISVTPAPPPGGSTPTCQPNAVTKNKIVKVLFVVDTSGSNYENLFLPGTDPDKKWRSTTIMNFINKYKEKSNFYYGLITFQLTSATPQIQANGKAIFSNNMAVVKSGYDRFMATADYNATPYKAALTMVKSTIAADLAANAGQKASYVVVMVSDGQPTDYLSPNSVIPDAHAIVNLAPSQVSLNSVYYFATAPRDSETKYLKNISTVGGGSFSLANSNNVLNIDDVIQLPPTNCK